MDKLYAIHYNGSYYRLKNKKNIYFSQAHARNAIRSLARRKVRESINSWKEYDTPTQREMIGNEILKFEVVEYQKQ